MERHKVDRAAPALRCVWTGTDAFCAFEPENQEPGQAAKTMPGEMHRQYQACISATRRTK